VDSRRFDEMARWLARTLPRRTVVEGSTAAGVLSWLGFDESIRGERKRQRKPKAKACLPNGKPCGKGKKGKKLTPCSKCCSGNNITTRSKKKKCACRPDGMTCTTPSQCCAGICFDGLCGAVS
jgi:hypothetical protein